MKEYIKKEGEVIYLVEYPTEKPEYVWTLGDVATIHYNTALESWNRSAVKTPFHDSQKEAVEEYAWRNIPGDTENALSEGIAIPRGLVEKHSIYKNIAKSRVFAFLKEAKPVEETEGDIRSKSISDIINQFENGQERYMTSPFVRQCVLALYNGQNPIHVIDQLIKSRDYLGKRFEDHIKSCRGTMYKINNI